MKKLFLLAMFFGFLQTNIAAQCGVKCGVERWAIKTLSDTTVTNVVFKPKRKTVHWLVNAEPPASTPNTKRVPGLEWINFRVKAVLVGYKLEDDHDFHVVIRDLQTNETMIVEFPSSDCKGVCSSQYVADIVKARNDFLNSAAVQEKGAPSTSYKKLTKRVIVEVIGIGFWDRLHGQTGVAKNGLELHPVIWYREVND
jgi:hypothetical protein